MADHQPPIKVSVTVAGHAQRHANIGAGLVHMALKNAGVTYAILDGVDTFGLDFENFIPVLLGDISFRIEAVEKPISN